MSVNRRQLKIRTPFAVLIGTLLLGVPTQAPHAQGRDEAQSVQETLQALEGMTDPGELAKAATALGRLYSTIGDPQILDALTELAESAEPDVRDAAQMALDAALPGQEPTIQPQQQQLLPFSVSAITVECNGECDNRLD
jgi:HEAT repeats